MAEVLDYSAGWPAPAAIRAGGYVGVVRYIGTAGHPKNLTRAEAQAMLAAGIPVGLVYELTAGWMLAGRAAGAAAAAAAIADAEHCKVGVRCVYFACDVDVMTSGQMGAVEQCLAGAAGVLGLDRVGVYGEADVIDACLSGRHARKGWQTRAWSGGRLSARAHLLQQIGYVYPGGVQCDHSTVLRTDWGQWPAPDTIEEHDMQLDEEDLAQVEERVWGHDIKDGPAVRKAWQALRDVPTAAGVAAVGTKVDELATQFAIGAAVDPAAVAAHLDYDQLGAAIARHMKIQAI